MKIGVLRLLADAARALFLNMVAVSSDPFGGAAAGDRLP